MYSIPTRQLQHSRAMTLILVGIVSAINVVAALSQDAFDATPVSKESTLLLGPEDAVEFWNAAARDGYDINARQMSLSNALATIADNLGVTVEKDEDSLKAAGVSPNTVIAWRGTAASSLGQQLTEILAPYGLDFTYAQGALFIASQREIEETAVNLGYAFKSDSARAEAVSVADRLATRSGATVSPLLYKTIDYRRTGERLEYRLLVRAPKSVHLAIHNLERQERTNTAADDRKPK